MISCIYLFINIYAYSLDDKLINKHIYNADWTKQW